jgi:hypothetical protein
MAHILYIFQKIVSFLGDIFPVNPPSHYLWPKIRRLVEENRLFSFSNFSTLFLNQCAKKKGKVIKLVVTDVFSRPKLTFFKGLEFTL